MSMKIYLESIDFGQGYINYYQPTTTEKLKRFIKKRGCVKAIVKFEYSMEFEELTGKELLERL